MHPPTISARRLSCTVLTQHWQVEGVANPRQLFLVPRPEVLYHNRRGVIKVVINFIPVARDVRVLL